MFACFSTATHATMTSECSLPGSRKIREIQPANQQKTSWQIKTAPKHGGAPKEPKAQIQSYGVRKWAKVDGYMGKPVEIRGKAGVSSSLHGFEFNMAAQRKCRRRSGMCICASVRASGLSH